MIIKKQMSMAVWDEILLFLLTMQRLEWHCYE